MSELISGKEAKLAWANGENVEFYSEDLDKWFSLNNDVFLSDVFDTRKLRLKPRTITINGIEVPAPFEPKEGDKFWIISDGYQLGYTSSTLIFGEVCLLGAWRTEEEIKQVVSALRSIFKGGVMSEFDKHWNEWAIASNCPEDEAKIHFEAGQQSKQAEIDRIVSIITEAYKSGGNSSVETVYDKIQELLK